MKKYCFNCHGEEFIPIHYRGEEVGRECLSCGARSLYDDYYFDGNDIKNINNE